MMFLSEEEQSLAVENSFAVCLDRFSIYFGVDFGRQSEYHRTSPLLAAGFSQQLQAR